LHRVITAWLLLKSSNCLYTAALAEAAVAAALLHTYNSALHLPRRRVAASDDTWQTEMK